MELQPFTPAGDTASRAVTTSSARVALTQKPGSSVELTVIVYNQGTIDAFVAFGDDTITATTASTPVPAGTSMVFLANNQEPAHIAAITASGATTLKITSGTGIPYGYAAGQAGGSATGENVNIAAAGGVAVVAATAPVPIGFYNPVGGALLDPTLPAEVVGNVSAAAADSGKPVKVGGKYNTTPPTLTDGQRGDAQLDSRSNLRATMTAAVVTGADGLSNALLGVPLATSANFAQTIPLITAPIAFNGSTWDRVRNAGSNLGLLTENGPYLLGRATADAQIKGSSGFIHTVSIAPLTATPTAGLLTIYNSTTETGTVVYAEWIFATTPGHTVTLDIPCGTGIYVGFDGTLANVQVTVAYR